MEPVFKFYSNKVMQGDDEFKMFSTFFRKDREYAEKWLDSCMQKLQTKDDDIANGLRLKGNMEYTAKNFPESLKLYTKGLCNAKYKSKAYNVILANRSALLFMLKDYKNSLKDINHVIDQVNVSESINLKLHIRKVKCCSKLRKQLNDAATEALTFLENSNAPQAQKDKFREDILIMTSCETSLENDELTQQFNIEDVPKLKDGANDTFLSASAAIRIKYDNCRGRHVVASKQINAGDVLFVEKPFVFAPIFLNEKMELSFENCYNCLRSISNGIPCKYCIRCVFCGESCRDDCWNEFHKWECTGMQANLWYKIGITFPAVRALIKGASSGFVTVNTSLEDDALLYGNAENNFPYFNRLISNVSKMTNVLPLIISAAVATLYLKKYTGFVTWVQELPNSPRGNVDDLTVFIGGVITKYIAQLQCNSSSIHHGLHSVLEETIPVACGIYPSVSMMNHSCNPNIDIDYVRDIVIVKASEKIKENEEISNCYGIDYRKSDFYNRQEQCSVLYYFKCKCRVCKLHK